MRIAPRSCASPTLSSERRRRFAKGDCLRRSPNAWLSVCSATLVLLAAGCGGGDGEGSSESPRLDPAVAEQLAAQSDAVADAIEENDGCAAAERTAELRATLDEVSVPEAIRAEVEQVAAREFTCAPPPPPPPPPATVPADGDDDDEGKKGKKDKKNRGDGDDD